MACEKTSLFRAPEGQRSRFSVLRHIPGIPQSAQRELIRMQEAIRRELDRALRSPRFADVKTASYSSSPGEFVRASPIGNRTITLAQPRRENQGEETRIMVEDLERGTLTIQALAGTVDKKPFVRPTAPGMLVATSNGVDNWSVTLFVGPDTTDGPTAASPPNTIEGNPTSADADDIPIPLGLHTVLLRGAGNIVARSLQTFFGDRLTYDEASNTVSADDQTAALTASNGVVRVVDDFQEAEQLAQSVKVNATGAVARPVPLPFGNHTFFANVGAGIVSRSLSTFYADGITYDPGSGTVSVDNPAEDLTASNGVARLVDDFRLAAILPNQTLVNSTAGTAVPVGVTTESHSFLARFGGTVESRTFSAVCGSGLTYDAGGEVINVDPIDVGLTDSNEGLQDDGTTVGIANNGVTLPKIAQVGSNRLIGNPNGATGNLEEMPTFTHSFYFRGAANLAVRGIAAMMGPGLTYNSSTEQIENSDTGGDVGADRNLDRSTGDIGMAGIAQHSFYARQTAGTGTPNVATCGTDQVMGRPGSGVIQGTQVVTNMLANLAIITGKIADGAVTVGKIASQNSNSIMGRFQGTFGPLSSLSFATHSFAAREGGTIFNKSLSSLAGANMSYNTGTGALDGPDPGDPVPANNNATITRNGAGTLVASSMGSNSVVIRSNGGSPGAFNFGTAQVLRSIGGVLGVGQLATDHLGNAIVTAAKILTSDAFTWGGAHTFGSTLFHTAVQTSNIGSATVVTLAGFTNTLRIASVGAADSLIGMTGGANGRRVCIMNTSTVTPLVIAANSGAAGTDGFAAATDQFYVIHPGGMGDAQYDGTVNRWRVASTDIAAVG